MWLFMPIYKCLLAPKSFTQDTFNLKTKQTALYFVDLNLIAVTMATDQQIEKNHVLTIYSQLYLKLIETCIITSQNNFNHFKT